MATSTEPWPRRLPAPLPDVSQPPGAAFPALAHLSLRLKTFRRLLHDLLPPRPGATLVDLGAGTGQFARIASRLGYAVTAVDVRRRWTTGGVEAAGGGPLASRDAIRRVTADLRHFDRLDAFDVVLGIGVLYHLPLGDQLALLRRSAGRPLVVDTEIYEPSSIPPDRSWRFRPVTSTEGYRGAMCRETDNVWSSAGDRESFWFTEASMLDAFRDANRTEVTIVDPPYRSAFGPRRWFVLGD